MFISIVMPAYNAEKFIEAAINSVLKQTFTEFELLIIDDCSSDGTLQIMQRYKEQDCRVQIFQNSKNSGVSFTRNYGVSKAKSEWIAFLDSDDMWDSEKLKKQIAVAQNNGAEFVFSGSAFIAENDAKSGYVLHVPKQIKFNELLKQNIISCSSVLIKKSLLLNNPMQRDDMHEDFAVWLKILKGGLCAYGVDEPLLIYRIQSKSKSGNKLLAAQMTYKVYRFIGLNFAQAMYNMIFYAIRNVYKYKKINLNFGNSNAN